MGQGALGQRRPCSGLCNGAIGPVMAQMPDGARRSRELRGVYGAQELHKLVTDHVRGFVLYPMADIIEFESPHETGKTGAHLVHGKWIEFFQSIRLSPDEKGR